MRLRKASRRLLPFMGLASLCRRLGPRGDQDGRSVASYFHKVWLGFWIYLAVYAIVHTYKWDSATPYLTARLLGVWEISSVIMGVWASFSAWWHVTADQRPRQLLYGWQILGWAVGHTFFLVVVTGFHVGVLMGMIFGLDATLHRYAEIPIRGFIINVDTARYVFLGAFLIVAFLQTVAIGRPIAREMIVWLLNRWERR